MSSPYAPRRMLSVLLLLTAWPTCLLRGQLLYDLPVLPTDGQPGAGVIEDFNEDGFADLAVTSVGSSGRDVLVFAGKGDGTFSEPAVAQHDASQNGWMVSPLRE